jgi:hypothetical protein
MKCTVLQKKGKRKNYKFQQSPKILAKYHSSFHQFLFVSFLSIFAKSKRKFLFILTAGNIFVFFSCGVLEFLCSTNFKDRFPDNSVLLLDLTFVRALALWFSHLFERKPTLMASHFRQKSTLNALPRGYPADYPQFRKNLRLMASPFRKT